MKRKRRGPQNQNLKKLFVKIKKEQYWCLEYLSTMRGLSKTRIIEEATILAMKRIEKNSTRPIKPVLDFSKSHRLHTSVKKELSYATEIVKINNDLDGWYLTDFIRYGLKIVIDKYQKRFPEMGNILRRYDENKIPGVEKLPELPQN